MPRTANYIVNGDQTVSFAMTDAAPTINGTAVAIAATDPTEIGWAQSSDGGEGADKFEARDGNGAVFCTILYNKNGDLSLTLLLKPSATLPSLGDYLVVRGKKGVIERVRVTNQNNEGSRCEVTAHHYAGISLTAAAPTPPSGS